MGSFLGEEKIGALSHLGGVITLQPSTVRVGGRMIRAGALSRTIATDVTLTANSLYMIFLVLVGGSPQLRISSNFNSVGPSGFAGWGLVGGFYSNGSSTFGSFIADISGVPRTGEISFDANINSQGLGILNPMLMNWSRHGDRFKANGVLHVGTRTGVEARIGMPFSPLTSQGATNQLCGTIGFGGNTAVTYGLIVTTGNSWVIPTFNSSGANGMNTGVLGTQIFTDGAKISPHWEIPIQGWSNTPLKDL